ncbi:MAG: VCBS repeat-containing protein [Xanthomonadales bacterium]|nr:VCBS repeat-containing protein [Xanthomonadales bacterium]
MGLPQSKKLALSAAVSAALLSAAPAVSAQAQISLNVIPPERGLTLQGGTDDRLGKSLSGAGDVNGDGLDDILLSALGSSDGGLIYVIFGTDHTSLAAIDLSMLNGNNGFVIRGNTGDNITNDLSSAGDINGDGVDDILIGNAAANKAIVVFGSNQGFPPEVNVGSLNGSNGFSLLGYTGDHVGISVSNAGDFNGDGFDDVIVGAPYAPVRRRSGMVINEYPQAGKSYLIFGSDQGFGPTLALGTVNGSQGRALLGAATADRAGYTVSAAGDVNGDGFDDVIVGSLADVAYVVFGNGDNPIASLRLGDLDGTDGYIIAGSGGEQAGRRVGGGADLNGDGFDEVLVGAEDASWYGVSNSGVAHIIFGHDQTYPTTFSLSSIDGNNGFSVGGMAYADSMGRSVEALGDVNGDGIDDVLLGASTADQGTAIDAGSSYLVLGNANGFPPWVRVDTLNGQNGVTISGAAALTYSGEALSGLGDVNGDGLDDFMISDRDANDFAGEVYVLLGNSAPRLASTIREIATVEDTAAELPVRTLDPLVIDIDIFFGLAIVGNPADPSRGEWQYSFGGNWQPVPTDVSDSSALILPESSGSCRFVPAPDYHGSSPPLSVRLWDGLLYSGNALGANILPTIGGFGGFSSDEHLLILTAQVSSVNDQPSFQAHDPPTAFDTAGPQTVTNWAAFDPGAANEAGQSPVYLVSAVGNPSLFSQLPSVSPEGQLSYAPQEGIAGTSSFAVSVVDDGGTSNGGIETSPAQVFTITVLSEMVFADSFED